MIFDDICAIATSLNTQAISVIRCSGPNVIKKVNNVFSSDLISKESHTITYGFIKDEEEIVDEVLVSVFYAPKSFTGENSVEISCHGGVLVTNKVLETLLKNDLRLAEPGEFSKRAFLNKRIDLSQADAIMDIIHAENDLMLKSANNSLRKQTTKLVNKLKEDLLEIIGIIEVNIDYPEYDDVLVMTNEVLHPKIEVLLKKIDKVLEHSKIAQSAIYGVKTVILGKPNVGKSSILNLLLDEDKAIVSQHAGTTRDLVEAKLQVGNVTLNLIDTAGVRNTEDEVEQIGISRTLKALKEASLVLLVLDNSQELSKTDYELLELTKDKKRIIIVNKSDLDKKLNLEEPYINISALNQIGFEQLEEELLKITKINEFSVSNNNYVFNKRHIVLLNEAKKHLVNAFNGCSDHQYVDMIEIDLTNALFSLNEILGETSPDVIINELFSKFCLGK